MKHPLDLQVVQETNDQDHRNREEPKADRLKRDHLLQLHAVLVDHHGVLLPLLDLLEHFIQGLHQRVDVLAVLLGGNVVDIRELNALQKHDHEGLRGAEVLDAELVLASNCSIAVEPLDIVAVIGVLVQDIACAEQMRQLVLGVDAGSRLEMVGSGLAQEGLEAPAFVSFDFHFEGDLHCCGYQQS